MSEWLWVDELVVRAIHDEQLSEHGGGNGVRDENLLLSALARPQNLAAYGEPDAADLAAAYAYGLARNHAFVDGNKRTAFVVALVFLAENGFELTADKVARVMTMLAVADGSMTEKELGTWLREHLRPADKTG